MKKIMTLMLGLGLIAGTTTFAFAQTDKDTSKKKAKKGGKKGTDAPKGGDKGTK
jgi:hypothetical protein